MHQDSAVDVDKIQHFFIYFFYLFYCRETHSEAVHLSRMHHTPESDFRPELTVRSLIQGTSAIL